MYPAAVLVPCLLSDSSVLLSDGKRSVSTIGCDERDGGACAGVLFGDARDSANEY